MLSYLDTRNYCTHTLRTLAGARRARARAPDARSRSKPGQSASAPPSLLEPNTLHHPRKKKLCLSSLAPLLPHLPSAPPLPRPDPSVDRSLPPRAGPRDGDDRGSSILEHNLGSGGPVPRMALLSALFDTVPESSRMPRLVFHGEEERGDVGIPSPIFLEKRSFARIPSILLVASFRAEIFRGMKF